VQINVVAVTDVHDVGFCAEARPRVSDAGDVAPPGEERDLNEELGCTGRELDAPICKDNYIT